jgi:sugar-specific transcriptional regulator TrmB
MLKAMQDALKAAGLHESLANTYLALLQNDYITPAKLSKITGESRTNTYKLLDELVELGLASKQDISKKLHYQAGSPTRLLVLARERIDELNLQEKHIKSQLPGLLKNYYKYHEQPGVRFFQGKEGIKEIYEEQIREGKPIRFMKTRADIEFFGFKFMHEIRNLAPKANIIRQAFTPDTPEVPKNIVESDKQMLLERTWYSPQDYTAPVEWSVYGNKVSIISFGQEVIGMVIDSPQIAESLRQMFAMLDEGLKKRPGYDRLPTKGEFIDADSFVTKYNNKAPKID